jgi:hypothetical protein
MGNMNKELKLIKVLEHYHLYDGDKAIATSIVGNPMLLPNLSIKNCQAIENGYDLDDIVKNHPLEGSNYSHSCGLNQGIEYGFQKALEILGDKKFSEKDVISMIEKSRETGLTAEYLILNNQQNEWDVEIVTEPMNLDEIREQGKGFLHCNTDKYKLDAEGKIILKRI